MEADPVRTFKLSEMLETLEARLAQARAGGPDSASFVASATAGLGNEALMNHAAQQTKVVPAYLRS